MTYYHKAYGYLFRSEIYLPELPEADIDTHRNITPDVEITFAEVAEDLDDPVTSGVVFQASLNEFLLKINGIAKYKVSDGNKIYIEPAPEGSENDIRVFMLGSVFGALLHQRQLLVLHAGAISTPNGAVLLSGPSGAGKSTLLGEMLKRGYPMMVDDVCAVTSNADSQLVVIPGYPRTRLWADAAKKLEIKTKGLQRTRPQLEKYERQVPSHFHNEAACLKSIYLLTSNNDDEIHIEPLPAIKKFSAVMQNTYRNAFLEGLELRRIHFELATMVATTTIVKKVTRPMKGFRLTELADAVESDFLQNER